jgi:hypothetical protein
MNGAARKTDGRGKSMKRKATVSYIDTPKGKQEYKQVKAAQQAEADRDGFDRGIEVFEGPMAYVHTFMLPAKQFRAGFELRCEVVMCSSTERTQPGHGCKS